MIRDEQADADIEWTPYGKVSLVDRGTIDQKVHFGYGPDQNRVMKAVVDVSATDTIFSYYIRDAQGNVMALYERQEDTVVWREQYLYGSNRLGLMESDVRWYPGDGHIDSAYHVINPVLYEGCKRYEIANHLGNVMAVVSDRREAIDSTSNSEADYYEAVVLTANDYYPFGQEMPGRTYNIGDYRYGFNGKEKDQNDEWGDLTHYDYGFRIYNPAIGRFLSVDPLAGEFPWVTPYNYAENRPIDGIDLWGLQYVSVNSSFYRIATGQIWVKTNNFQSGADAFGQRYIGTSVPRFQVNLTKGDGSSFPVFRRGAADFTNLGNNLRRLYESAPPVKSGERLDRRFNSTKAYESASGRAAGLGKLGLTLAALDLAHDVYTSITGYQESVEADKQIGLIRQSFEDVLTALGEGNIPSQFHNLQDLSAITNFVYQGEDTFGDNEKLRNTAIYISRFISGNYKGDDEYIQPDSDLDNFKPSPILIRPPLIEPEGNNN